MADEPGALETEMRLYIVAWYLHGDWRTSQPFYSAVLAQEQIDSVLKRGEAERARNTLYQIIPIDVSETEVHNPHANFGNVQGENLVGNGTTDGLPSATDEEAAESLK